MLIAPFAFRLQLRLCDLPVGFGRLLEVPFSRATPANESTSEDAAILSSSYYQVLQVLACAYPRCHHEAKRAGRDTLLRIVEVDARTQRLVQLMTVSHMPESESRRFPPSFSSFDEYRAWLHGEAPQSQSSSQQEWLLRGWCQRVDVPNFVIDPNRFRKVEDWLPLPGPWEGDKVLGFPTLLPTQIRGVDQCGRCLQEWEEALDAQEDAARLQSAALLSTTVTPHAVMNGSSASESEPRELGHEFVLQIDCRSNHAISDLPVHPPAPVVACPCGWCILQLFQCRTHRDVWKMRWMSQA